MKFKQALLFSSLFILCSPTKNEENIIIGKWVNVSLVNFTGLNPTQDTNGVPVLDTIIYTKELEINEMNMKFNLTAEFKNKLFPVQDTVFNYAYEKKIDTLKISRQNKISYYKYNLQNDSLFLNYLYGDTIKFDSLTSEQVLRMKKQ